jgi:hypothetical protein
MYAPTHVGNGTWPWQVGFCGTCDRQRGVFWEVPETWTRQCPCHTTSVFSQTACRAIVESLLFRFLGEKTGVVAGRSRLADLRWS